MTKQRRFGRGDLHVAVLALLARRPMHGYDLMSELGERMGRRYKPSPGSIYPAVAALEADGYIAAEADGDRRVYHVTPEGTEALARRLDQLARIESEFGVRLGDDSAPAALARFTQRARGVAGKVDAQRLQAVLDDAITTLENLAKEGPT